MRYCVAAYVIDKQIVQWPGSDLLRIGFNPNDGDLPFEKWTQIARSEMKEYADHTVDPSFEHAIEALLFFSWKPIGIVDQNVVAVSFRTLLRAAFKGGVKRVSNVRDDTGDRFGAPGAETLSDPVRYIAKVFCGPEHLALSDQWD